MTITDEGEYFHLIRTGRFVDPDKAFQFINPDRTLPRLTPGTMVTVLRECGLGDVLMVLVVIRAMRQKFPKLRFRIGTGRAYVKLCEGLDFLDGAHALMDMGGRVPNVIDFRNFVERHPRRDHDDRIDIFASHCGVQVSDYSLPTAPVTDGERMRARDMIGPGSVIALAVRGSTHVRTWPLPNVTRFAELAAERGWKVAVLDSSAHEMPQHPGIVNLTGRASLLEVKAIVAESEFCVSPDSGLQHLAEATGTKCLALYSTIPPGLRIGHYRHVKAVWRESHPCVPCFDRGCPGALCTHIAPERVLRGIENFEALGMATNADTDPLLMPAPKIIEVASESEIMACWPGAR